MVLSVSCIGSNGLKLILGRTVNAVRNTFSILYRIEWVETTPIGLPDYSAGGFQYPVSDRMG